MNEQAIDPVQQAINQALTEAAQRPEVQQLMQMSTALAQFLPFNEVVNDAQMNQVTDAYNASLSAKKKCLELSDQYAQWPEPYLSAVNKFFDGIYGGIDKSCYHLGKLMDAWVAKNKPTPEEQTAKQIEKMEVTNGEPMMPPSKPGPKRTSGEVSVTIENPVELLKVCVSKSDRNKWLMDGIGKFVTFNEEALAQMITENKKRTVPGCKIVRG